MAQCLVAFQPAPRPDEQLEPVIETIAHLGRGHRLHPRRRQLDRQRNPVEAATDLFHRGRLIRGSSSEHAPRTTPRPHRLPARAPATIARRRRPSPSRLVARIFTVADCARMVSIRSAAASTTCSQLSNTSSRTVPSSAAATDSLTVLPGCWVMPSTAATASGTAAGSVTAASSKTHTPSGNSSASCAATSSASRVLPTPPTPVKVTNRCDRTRGYDFGDLVLAADQAGRSRAADFPDSDRASATAESLSASPGAAAETS